MALLRGESWDTHVHVFDTTAFPFKHNRAYTPSDASIVELIRNSSLGNFLIVQASVETDSKGLLYQLQKAQELFPDRKFRGTILFDPHNGEDWSYSRTALLQNAGIRCVRIHGKFGNMSGTTYDMVAENVKDILRHQISSVVRRQGWAISMQLPLDVWTLLEDFIKKDMVGVPIVAEHCATIHLPLDAKSDHAVTTLCRMLTHGNLYIKLGALHRRMDNKDKDDCSKMESIIRRLVAANPRRLLWGSDWPHVDSTAKGSIPAPNLTIDHAVELDLARRAMSGADMELMLCENPERLFGV